MDNRFHFDGIFGALVRINNQNHRPRAVTTNESVSYYTCSKSTSSIDINLPFVLRAKRAKRAEMRSRSDRASDEVARGRLVSLVNDWF